MLCCELVDSETVFVVLNCSVPFFTVAQCKMAKSQSPWTRWMLFFPLFFGKVICFLYCVTHSPFYISVMFLGSWTDANSSKCSLLVTGVMKRCFSDEVGPTWTNFWMELYHKLLPIPLFPIKSRGK